MQYQPCHPVIMVASADQALLLWGHIICALQLESPRNQLPERAATEHEEGAVTHTATLSVFQFAGSSASHCISGGLLSPHDFRTLSHLSAAGPQNPWGEGDFSAQLYKTLCCTRHPKIIPTCLPVTPGGMRSPQWGVICPESAESGMEEAESLSLKRLLERWLPAAGFQSEATGGLNTNPIFHKHETLFLLPLKQRHLSL